MTSTGLSTSTLPRTQAEWRAALSALPATPGRIPAFYFADGSPMLAFSDTAKNYNTTSYKAAPMHVHGPRGTLAAFLRDFGRMLLPKYRPRGIVVFSAHWDTTGERLGASFAPSPPAEHFRLHAC